jgi:hypothetical protein
VTQRVKKTPKEGPPAGTPAYTRTWSIAINTITAPRMMSSDTIRVASPGSRRTAGCGLRAACSSAGVNVVLMGVPPQIQAPQELRRHA